MKIKDFPSPCVSICKLNVSTGFCDGCFRTKDEIASWPNLDYEGKIRLIDKLRDRQGLRKRKNRRYK